MRNTTSKKEEPKALVPRVVQRSYNEALKELTELVLFLSSAKPKELKHNPDMLVQIQAFVEVAHQLKLVNRNLNLYRKELIPS
jgi:hypothetical protein